MSARIILLPTGDPPPPEIVIDPAYVLELEHEVADLRHTVSLQSAALWKYHPLRVTRRSVLIAVVAFLFGWLCLPQPHASVTIRTAIGAQL